jgi:hypothetical protein
MWDLPCCEARRAVARLSLRGTDVAVVRSAADWRDSRGHAGCPGAASAAEPARRAGALGAKRAETTARAGRGVAALRGLIGEDGCMSGSSFSWLGR